MGCTNPTNRQHSIDYGLRPGGVGERCWQLPLCLELFGAADPVDIEWWIAPARVDSGDLVPITGR